MWTLYVWEQCKSNILSGHVSYAGNCCAFDWSNKCCWTRSQWTCKVKVFFVRPCLLSRPFLSPLHSHQRQLLPLKLPPLASRRQQENGVNLVCSVDRSFLRYITSLQLTFPSETIIATSSISSTFPSRWLIIIAPLASRQQPGQQENGVNRGEATETKARGSLSGSSPDF